jgi:hypothetical protein
VSCAQCCLFLWIVFVLCLVPSVACFSGLFILDSLLRFSLTLIHCYALFHIETLLCIMS